MDTTEAKTKLEQQKKQLEAELSRFAKKDPSLKDDWDTNYPRIPGGSGSLEEAADEVEEYSTNLRVEFALERQLRDVNAALDRIEKGRYGICEKCGNTVAPERLKVSPEAATCSTCAM